MSDESRFERAFPYGADVLALPVKNADVASRWYQESFGLEEVGRLSSPCKTVIMARDGIRIGFAENGGDSANDGAAILVRNIAAMRDELEKKGIVTGNWRVDERDGEKLQVFFVTAPDKLCYYFHEPLSDT